MEEYYYTDQRAGAGDRRIKLKWLVLFCLWEHF